MQSSETKLPKHYLLSLFLALITFSSQAQNLNKHVLNPNDDYSGYYYAAAPKGDSIVAVLVLLAGFGQKAEDTPPETKLHLVAAKKNVLTVFFAAGNKLYADSVTCLNLNRVINDVLSRYHVNKNTFVLAGFSAGGMVALRYAELCLQYPASYPIKPLAAFTVDSPLDIFTIYEQLEESAANHYSEPAYEEAERAIAHIKADHGVPREHPAIYTKLTAFCMDKSLGQNEVWLKKLPLRVYHDVDIAWRIVNRHLTVHRSNYEVSAELINRLQLMGNLKAEFMQSFKTGYRANGQRHPHSWSIVNETECLQWIHSLLQAQ